MRDLDLGTHQETLEAQGQKIRDTRVKVEAYASLLSDKSGELLAAVDAANELLTDKITGITREKAASEEGSYILNLSKTDIEDAA